jgi:signal transduction histidine kinase
MVKWPATFRLAVALLSILIAGASAQPAADSLATQPRQILILQSYGQDFQPFATWSRETRRELTRQSPWPLGFQEHFLVTALTGSDTAESQFVEYLSALYADRPPDLIIAFGAPAARFFQKYRVGLFQTVPMLLGAVNVKRVDDSMLSERDAVVGTLVEHVPLFENILRLLPQTEVIAVIIGNSPPERLWVEQLQLELKPLLRDRVKLRFYNERPFDEILQDVGRLPPRSAIFFQQMMVDGAGVAYGDKDPLKSIAAFANAPIFTFDQSLFHGRVVGGPMTSALEGARSTAAVAVRMLNGDVPGSIDAAPIAFASPIYDWRELKRWKISERLLPPGSEIVFREPRLWERYPAELSLVAAAILLQAGLIVILLRERQLRHLAEVDSRQRMAELAHVNRFSTAGELSASIAHEINQPLGTILSNAEAAQIILKSPSPDIAALNEIIGEILHNDERASEVIKRVRSLLKRRPFEPEDFDLNDLAGETLEFLSALAHGRNVDLSGNLAPDALPVRGDRVQLQQVILNLVINGIDAMKDLPSGSRVITIQTSHDKEFAELSVSDSGPGIPEDRLKHLFEPFFTTKAEGMGMGLSIARTIVAAHDGEIVAKNRDEGGATFRVRLPLRS